MIKIKKPQQRKRGVCFRLTEPMIKALDKIAQDQNVDRTAVIETALETFLELYYGSKKK